VNGENYGTRLDEISAAVPARAVAESLFIRRFGSMAPHGIEEKTASSWTTSITPAKLDTYF